MDIGADPVLIGRAPECQIRSQDGLVSRRHAQITVSRGVARWYERSLRWILAHKAAFFVGPALIFLFGVFVTAGSRAFFGERLSAEEAAANGLLSRAVPPDTLDCAVKEITDSIIDKSPITSVYPSAFCKGDDSCLIIALGLVLLRTAAGAISSALG